MALAIALFAAGLGVAPHLRFSAREGGEFAWFKSAYDEDTYARLMVEGRTRNDRALSNLVLGALHAACGRRLEATLVAADVVLPLIASLAAFWLAGCLVEGLAARALITLLLLFGQELLSFGCTAIVRPDGLFSLARMPFRDRPGRAGLDPGLHDDLFLALAHARAAGQLDYRFSAPRRAAVLLEGRSVAARAARARGSGSVERGAALVLRVRRAASGRLRDCGLRDAPRPLEGAVLWLAAGRCDPAPRCRLGRKSARRGRGSEAGRLFGPPRFCLELARPYSFGRLRIAAPRRELDAARRDKAAAPFHRSGGGDGSSRTTPSHFLARRSPRRSSFSISRC
jgi:hypothetical protein